MKAKILPHFVRNNRHYTHLWQCIRQRHHPTCTATGPLQISWLRSCAWL